LAWAKNASETLCAAGDTLDSGTFTARKFVFFMSHIPADYNTINSMVFNNDTGTKYSRKKMENGGSGDSTSRSDIALSITWAHDKFVIGNFINIATEEKIGFSNQIEIPGTGASSIPARTENPFKYTETSNQVTSIKMVNVEPDDYLADANITVFGTD
jgi:uncharacterized membrane protein YcgQ (UPF0703/DUF1980 family)